MFTSEISRHPASSILAVLLALSGCGVDDQDFIAQPILPGDYTSGGYGSSGPSSSVPTSSGPSSGDVSSPGSALTDTNPPEPGLPPAGDAMQGAPSDAEPAPSSEPEPSEERGVVDGAGLGLPKPEPTQPEEMDVEPVAPDVTAPQPDLDPEPTPVDVAVAPGDPDQGSGVMQPGAMQPADNTPAASNPPDCPGVLPADGVSCFSFSQCVYGTSTCSCMTSWQCSEADGNTVPEPGGTEPAAGADVLWQAAWTAFSTSCTGFGCHSMGAAGMTINPADEAATRAAVTSRQADILTAVEGGMMPPMGGLSDANRQAIIAWASAP